MLPMVALGQGLTVLEYRPAPGQFVNTLPLYEEGDSSDRMAQKCTEALANGSLITLGAWGGNVTFRFDHPVVNVPGEKDLYIAGNAIDGSSEAGIVMVSQDTNHNGLPDDEWYELYGSADDDIVEVAHDYELTYRFAEDLADVPWSDNYGNTGVVARNAFHQQEYFPLWLKEEGELSFSGTRLPDNAHDTSGNGSYWTLDPFPWGYVDNLPNKDRDANCFNIDNAVERHTRCPAYLTYIDFVRVYTALNQSAGWLGETSTEVSAIEDLHPEASAAISELTAEPQPESSYDLLGRRVLWSTSSQTISIKNKQLILINKQ